MARRISVFDWSTTALGEKATWPQSLKTAVDIMLGCGFPAALWAGDRSVTLYNDAYAALLNGRDDLGGAGLGALEPASAPLASAIEESWRGKALTFEDQPLLFPGEQSADGRRFTLSCSPVRDEVGAVAAVLVILSETTERAHAGQSLNLMVAELQHRVRNILAVIRSIVSRSAETSDTVEDLSAHLDGRLAALARTQVLLTRSPGAGVDLESLIRDELLAQVADEDRIVIEGPEVLLHPKAAEVMTLAVHELATNATKYGALATALGHIDIGWTVGEGGWIDFKWRESGVKVAAAAPRRVGFGSVLVEQRVPYELMGTGALAFAPGGVQCEISFPLTPIPSVLQSDARER
ncbi:MAG: PAS domain-containing protein [Caulobacter sp.]|nr:PAS domain-containing protein [Caulobacter sp.]